MELYRRELADYLKSEAQQDGWEWFMHRSHGFAGTPMVLIKLLPELDDKIWGTPGERFSKFGHFSLPDDKERPLPSTLGMASFPVQGNRDSALILTTETCGTCHMGRVRLTDPEDERSGGEILYLYGGVNNQFDIRMWRTALGKTVTQYLATPSDRQKVAAFVRHALKTKEPGYFHHDLNEDRQQRDIVLADGKIETILEAFVAHAKEFSDGRARQLQGPYAPGEGRHPPGVDEGQPGQVDASGDLVAQRLPPGVMEGLPTVVSLTDIPSVWRQNERANGQWDGSVSEPFLRNLAAQIAVVPGSTVDRRVADLSLAFTGDLPAPKFPFTTINQDLARQGQPLFEKNCADCHRPHNANFYAQLGTDFNRAKVMPRAGSAVVGGIFREACRAQLPGGVNARPCDPNMGNYLRSTHAEGGQGYAAAPLDGIWARAPYLHNGSVPTLRHLLDPRDRPTRFVVGSLGYDADNVGFHWEETSLATYQRIDPQARLFDTTMDGLSNKGHDQKVLTIGSTSYRLDWSDGPKEDLEALLEYLKTL